jgi:hypothetical protein
MLATTTDMMRLLPELNAVNALDATIIPEYLTDSERLVILDGFQVVDDNFDLLHKYMTAHLLHANNIVRGEIITETVQDVTTGYNAREDKAGFADKWERKYVQLKLRLQGFNARLA